MGNFKLVNLDQTKEERLEKYWLARSLGVNPSWARRMRDWRLIKIERQFDLLGNIEPQQQALQLNIATGYRPE